MILNSYGPFRPPYISPEWAVDIEISVQSSFHPSRTFALFSYTNKLIFNENELTYSNLIVILMINLRLDVITNTQVLYFYFEKHLSLYWTYYKLA